MSKHQIIFLNGKKAFCQEKRLYDRQGFVIWQWRRPCEPMFLYRKERHEPQRPQRIQNPCVPCEGFANLAIRFLNIKD